MLRNVLKLGKKKELKLKRRAKNSDLIQLYITQTNALWFMIVAFVVVLQYIILHEHYRNFMQKFNGYSYISPAWYARIKCSSEPGTKDYANYILRNAVYNNVCR